MNRATALQIYEDKFKQSLPKASKKKIKELAELALATAESEIGMNPPEIVVGKSTYWTEFEAKWEDVEGSGPRRTC